MKFILAVMVSSLLFFSACQEVPVTIAQATGTPIVGTSKAQRALEALGFEDIQWTGYRFTGCADGDTFHTGFKAKNVRNKDVTGVVCSGFFKDATVRID